MTDVQRILVAEDEPHILELVTITLAREGRFEVYNATHGVEALDAAKHLRPSIAILDLMMPRVHGLTVCRTLKEDPLTSHVGVIMLTAIGSRYSKNQAAEFGADAYLTKPFSPRELINTVDIVLRNRPTPSAEPMPTPQRHGTWEFHRGQEVIVLGGPGEPELPGIIKSRFLSSTAHDRWGYVVGLNTGLDIEVPWDSVLPAGTAFDRAV